MVRARTVGDMCASLDCARTRERLREMTGLARFRSLRDSLEAAVLPLATSLDADWAAAP